MTLVCPGAARRSTGRRDGYPNLRIGRCCAISEGTSKTSPARLTKLHIRQRRQAEWRRRRGRLALSLLREDHIRVGQCRRRRHFGHVWLLIVAIVLSGLVIVESACRNCRSILMGGHRDGHEGGGDSREKSSEQDGKPRRSDPGRITPFHTPWSRVQLSLSRAERQGDRLGIGGLLARGGKSVRGVCDQAIVRRIIKGG